ncbi:MAG: hypothetical protein WCW30_04425 [Candidatus Gracilibacteria bacterium]
MKKFLFPFAVALLLSGCAATVEDNTTVPDTDVGDEVSDNTNPVDTVGTLNLNLFTFTLPSDWTLVSQTETTAKISIPDYETYTLSLNMELIETETGIWELPDSETTVETTSDGVEIYNIGCGGVFDCGNLAYGPRVYNYSFTIESTEPVPENLDGIWVPNSSVSHEDIAAFISTLKVMEDIGYGHNEDGSNENIRVSYGSNDRIPAPEGWVSLIQGSFFLYAPSGWALTPEQGIDTDQGIDTYVGTVSGDGISLVYNYGVEDVGMFSDNSQYPLSDYDVMYTLINGWDAIIYTPKTTGEGPMVLNIESPKGEGNFTLSGKDLNADQEAVVFNIFRTVFFAQ